MTFLVPAADPRFAEACSPITATINPKWFPNSSNVQRLERLAALVAIDLNGPEGLLQEVESYLEKAFSYLEKPSIPFVLGHLWSA